MCSHNCSSSQIRDKISLFKVIYFHVLCFNVLLISECFPFILRTQELISGWFIVLQNISMTFYLSSNILSFRQYILAPTNIVNPSIFWFGVLFIQNFAFLISYPFILMFVFFYFIFEEL